MALDNRSIYVDNFSISTDGLSIDVSVRTEVGETINSCKFWTDATYKDSAQLIDLSSLLSGVTHVENFTISVSDVEETTFFDGIFFAEFNTTAPNTEDCNTCRSELAVAVKLVAAKLCLLEKVLNLDMCLNRTSGCNCIETCEILALDNLVDSMVIALEFGLYNEAIDLLNGVRVLCPACVDCLDVTDINLSTGLGYGTLDNTFVLG